jgi:hypothetical protein
MATTPQRQAMIDAAHWVMKHGSGWRYEEIRPIPLANIKAGRLPIHTDCSGSVIGIAYRAGVHDPSGYKFDGWGNTDSLKAHCEHIDHRNCLAGDMVNIQHNGDGGSVHVYLVMEKLDDGDFSVFSHGGPDGTPPGIKRLSSVQGYWYGRGYYFQGLRFLEVAPPKKTYRWHVMTGAGVKIGKTNHPKLWVATHPGKIFRTYDQVRFVDVSD